MNIYSKNTRWKLLLLLMAVAIGVSSLYYTNILVDKLTREERNKVEVLAEAFKLFADENTSEYNYGILSKIIENNETIPVVVTNDTVKFDTASIMFYNNIDSVKLFNPKYAEKRLKRMKEENGFIPMSITKKKKQYIFYDKSSLLINLTYFPYIQLVIILFFIVVSYLAFNASRNAEQNQVWVGLSKETAHQLGTPTSSLMAWIEILKEKNIDKETIGELEKDVIRLNKITERFSKIGSKPKLSNENIVGVINNVIDYIKTRSSDKIKFNFEFNDNELIIPLNVELFEWVIENICKNAIDAMEGEGIIDISITDHTQVLYIDITDTGKGIPKSKFKTIFKPGYTTKERGWGLGLSLTERIVEAYHDGKVFVNTSEIGKGTKFRVVLRKY